MNIKKTAATLTASVLLATPLALTASPAQAADREFNYAGAEVEFDVSRDDGRYEVEVDVDDARPGSKWRIVLFHNGKRYYRNVKTADRDGDVEVETERRNTRGKDVFKLRIKRVGGPAAKTVRVVKR